MSRFFTDRLKSLEAYVPGEQPKDMKYIKLNTNESPFPPSPSVIEAAREEAGRLQLYSDPECTPLVAKFAELYGIDKESVIMTNGSDEVLNFAFMAFSDEKRPLAFPDITYGFYPVFARLNRIPYEEIPLKEDFTVDYRDYVGINKNIVIANPNAPTGMALSLDEIEEIIKSNPDNLVLIDEAYVDFGGESAILLTKKYRNLLVTGTFSKSRSLAGARLGFGIASPEIIRDLNTIKYSTNPYNVNRMTMMAGYSALVDNEYYMNNCKTVIENREYTAKELERLGFTVLPSKTNFVFAKSPDVGGEELYLKLKARGILVRHFKNARIKDFNRITIGTKSDMQSFISNVEEILKEKSK
ncbi:MAG: histidinol-phosphate transaminase [Clostridia bacterium]|nr:histidinol-phosphate transaminase [Clostridia bacterium]